MKKVLVAGAALMLAGGLFTSAASAAEVKPGVVVTGDARVRTFYRSEEYKNNWGNTKTPDYSSSTDMDSRVRLNFTGTAAGGAYAKARIRMMDTSMGDMDTDASTMTNTNLNQSNIWVDIALMGIPFNDMVTVELGKYRSTYGPLPTTYNFFYDDVSLSGGRGIIKTGNLEINPFIEWMDEAQNSYTGTGSGTVFAAPVDTNGDNDEMRFGAHLKYNVNKDWVVGGMLGYQNDERAETPVPANGNYSAGITQNTGGFGSIYAKGKSGQIGVVGELAVTAADLNGFNSWIEDTNINYLNTYGTSVSAISDQIGSNDTGFGGYVQPSYTMDKLTMSLNLGFTADGFLPDRAFGFVMLGSSDNSTVITRQQIGATGDWMWAGLIANYKINEQLQLTGNLVYADVNAWDSPGDGPGWTNAINSVALENAWELSGVLQYTISKGMNVFLSAGYLDPSLEYVNKSGTPASLEDDASFGTAARFELAF